MMKMMDTRKRLWMMVTLLTTLIAGAQQQGIVRTLERPGKASEALSGVTIDVLEYPNAIVSKKGGQFSFAIPGKRQGDSYTVSRVQKKGYTLVDKQMKGRRYAYSSSVPLEIVMVSDSQLENDKKRIEDKAYDKAKKTFEQKVAALEKRLNQKTISEQEYRAKYEELSSNYNNYVQLIDQMAERYATTDYSGMDETSKEIQTCIENADLEQADELINSKGDFDKREQELLKKKQLKEKSDQLSQQLQEDIDVEFEDLVRDYYNKYTINAAAYRNDSAAYYLERICNLVPESASMAYHTARFIMQTISDFPRAEHYYLTALELAKLDYGEQSEEVGAITEDLGLLYDNMLDYDKAIEWHQRALDILEPIVGADNRTVAMAYTLIGRAYCNKLINDKALEYTLKGLEIRERMESLEYKAADLSQSYNNLGVIYTQMGDLDKGIEYHTKALNIRESSFGSEDGSTALSYLNIGDIYLEKQDYATAKELIMKALAIYDKKLGPVNPYTAATYSRLGNLFSLTGDYDQALEWYNKLEASYDKLYGEDYPKPNCHIAQAGVYYNMGNTQQAIALYKQVVAELEQLDSEQYQDAINQFNETIKKLQGTDEP